VATKSVYKKPYLDSGVFIAWIKGEKVLKKTDSDQEIVVERGAIGEHILTLAEQQVFPVIISALTIAEVHKKRGAPKLEHDENDNLLDYFEHDFVHVVSVDRTIGEEANRLCRMYQGLGLSPNDAIHIACAKKAGCDALLSWDDVMNSITDQGIRIEEPSLVAPPPPPAEQEELPFEEDIDEQENRETAATSGEAHQPSATHFHRSPDGSPEGQADEAARPAGGTGGSGESPRGEAGEEAEETGA
jgi:predicted nucleic acid-binding protein